jgi:hypothetical protein
MKQVFLLLLPFTSLTAFTQDCADYYYLQNNKTIEITISTKKGKETGKNIYIISNVVKTGGTTTATVNSEFLDSKGKSISRATNNIKCTGGVLMMDMKMFISPAQQEQMGQAAATASNVYLEYPATMKEGDMLKDGIFNMDFKSQAGLASSVSVNITNRKVEGKETITTPGGTWECFRISLHSKIVIKMLVSIPINADVTEWYAPGFGVVKTESGGGNTEITSIK